MRQLQTYPPIANAIISEIYRSMELLRADKQLLALIGGWNETLPDEMVLEGLRLWIKLKRQGLRQQKNRKPRQRRVQSRKKQPDPNKR